jgi:hypothetical protein
VALKNVKRTLEVWLIRNRHRTRLPDSQIFNQMRLADLGVDLHACACCHLIWYGLRGGADTSVFWFENM